MKKKLFSFASGKSPGTAKPKTPSTRAPKMKDPKEIGPFFIRGIKAGSKEEYWVSIVLDEFQEQQGWSWDYQVPIYGGRARAGGNVVDFLIDTPGMKTMLDPMGRYWHTGAREDRNQMENVARRKHWRLIAWFTDETPTLEAMRTYLRSEMNA